LPEFQLGERVYNSRSTDGKSMVTVVAAMFADEDNRLFALVPKAIASANGSLYIPGEKSERTAFADTGARIISPTVGAFAAIEIRGDVVLREIGHAYSTERPHLMEDTDLSGATGLVAAFRSSLTTRQGHIENDCFLVEYTSTEAHYAPIIGQPTITQDGITGIVFGVASDQKLVAAAPFSSIIERFSGSALRLAGQSVFIPRTFRIGHDAAEIPPSVEAFKKWLANTLAKDGIAEEFRSTDDLMDQLDRLTDHVELDEDHAIALGKETFASVKDMVARSPFMKTVRCDLRSALLVEGGIFSPDEPTLTLGELIYSAYEIRQRQKDLAA
jgi:hypothetical protein